MTHKDIKGEIEQLSNLKTMVQAYEEIAATYMRRIRNSVILKREFLEGLSDIFKKVKESYKTEIQILMQRKKIKDTTKASLMHKNGKTVLVLISANTGLYGDIIKRTYRLFLQEAQKGNADVALIGKLGHLLYNQEKDKLPITYFEFPDNTINQDMLRDIVTHLIQYERIVVFFGKFQSVVTQTPAASSISGDEPAAVESDATAVVSDAGKKQVPIHIQYLFEPSLEKILNFFETEVMTSIFEQTVHESQLAKFASRMTTLDKAGENISGTLKKTLFWEQRFKHHAMNKKQLATLSSISLWRN
ncbi:MAG: hypothetical protein A3J69_00130 [Candidatus Levybacteria bacterium RIFCSPHIGHO2_02_FULL_42_12]|nr:MAG: hypothetical protein A3J69_00130 [Candidatus Levybacteria bacterium RIFCSPHIGHO2_02_FULL_42_12]